MPFTLDPDAKRAEFTPAHQECAKWIGFFTYILGESSLALTAKPQRDGSVIYIWTNGKNNYFFHVHPDGRIVGSHDLPQPQ